MTGRALVWPAAIAYAAGFAALSALRHRAFETGRFDLGNMVQAVWTTAHGHPLRVTNLAGEQVSRLGSHADPLLVAFAPLWWLWPRPELLLTVQAAAVAAGALPVYWLARKHLASPIGAAGFALAYLLYPPLQWATLSEFHAVTLACPLLLFALWYLDENRLFAFAVLASLAALTKEEIGLVVAATGLWYASSRGRWLTGAAIAIAGIGVTLVAVEVLVPHFHGGTSPFVGRYRDVGGSPLGVLETLVSDPAKIARTAFDERGLRYLLALVLPLAGLSLAAPLALVIAVPELALNLLSSVTTQTSIEQHYAAAATPGLLAAAIFGAARLGRRPGLVALAVVAAGIAANYRLGALPVWSALPGGADRPAALVDVSRHDTVAAQILGRIPDDAVVSATNTLGAHVSARRRVLSFPRLADSTWVAVDERRPSVLDRASAREEGLAAIRALRRDRRWHVVLARDGVVLFRRVTRGSPAGGGTPKARR